MPEALSPQIEHRCLDPAMGWLGGYCCGGEALLSFCMVKFPEFIDNPGVLEYKKIIITY